MTSLSFSKVATVGSTGLTAGRIYFETSTGLIKVATSATATEIFGGVRSASYSDETKVLTIINQAGKTITLDLSDVASADSVTAELAKKLDIGTSADASTVQSYYGLKKYADEAKASAISSANSYTDEKIGEIPAAIVYRGDETTITQSGSGTVTFSVGTIAQDKVKGLTTALAGKAPSSHTHTSAQITDLQDKLDAKANKSHTHAIADLTNLNEGWDALLIAAPDVAKNTELTALKGRVNTAETKLSGIEAGAQVNVIEGVQVNGVDLVPSGKKVNVTIPAATVTGVKANDKIISLDKTQLSSTLTMDYNSKNKLISLKGIGGAVISTIDATDFIKDGMVDSVSFDSKSKKLTITFNTVAGKDAIEVDLTSLVDTYTAGNGISISDNSIAINTAVVATKTDVNAVDSKLGNGFSSTSTVTSQLAAVKATADAAQTSSQVNAAITTAIEKLDKTDTAVLNQFVTAVSETNGIVAVTRKALEINDIPSIPVSKITGLSGNVIVVGGEGTHADSMIDATVEDLYKKVASAATSGVTSFAGKTGAITLKAATQTNGSVNLAVSEGRELSASIVGLGSAAYTASTAYATAAQGKKADTAVQSVVTGETNGTIKVDGAAVQVHGLGSAAYQEIAAFDANGAAATAKSEAISAASTDATNKANTAESNAKKYADSLWTWATFE